ncbi:ORF10 [White spot syndrome virus]|uniref:Wsv428 n=3 Tax=White spot syndrome virus TaxID=342409 RepID=Q8VAI5_WSSVS|nr:wsv428 [Shrimp white spot syndrome virus]AFX59805.1 wsv428 [White spot syndrome virus]AAL33430.1 wsv428 [Shrimp white spot syndrome virus]AAL89355.1 WSSV487 [Shrimp white spot syndrome virus]ATU84156.1 ORF10 [White spot syndrome virus]AWQ60552.1 wsv428 [Shrimp white spot syndrome virus]
MDTTPSSPNKSQFLLFLSAAFLCLLTDSVTASWIFLAHRALIDLSDNCSPYPKTAPLAVMGQ